MMRGMRQHQPFLPRPPLRSCLFDWDYRCGRGDLRWLYWSSQWLDVRIREMFVFEPKLLHGRG